MSIRALAAAVVVAGSLLTATAVPAAAGPYRDVCNGVYETGGCQYCARTGSATASPSYYCEWGWTGYYWVDCNLWVSGVCVTGALD